MLRLFGLAFVLAGVVAGFSDAQYTPTKTTHSIWRPDASQPDGGHFVHFYDHKAMMEKQKRAPKNYAKALPPAPATFDYATKITYPMDLNDQYGDCFYASICHHDNTFTGNIGVQSVFSLSSIKSRYFALSGGDNGLSDPDVQGEWKNRYIADAKEAKAIDFLYVNTTDPAAISSGMYYFGGTQFTFTVAGSWINNSNTGAIWDANSYSNNNNGHAVHWAGVDSKGNYKLVTWGTYVWITPAGVRVCNPDGFIVFSVRWFDPKTGYAPNGKHIVELAKIWQDAGGKAIPASVIAAFPPPGDPPIPPLPPVGGTTITLNKAMAAGTYSIVPHGAIVVTPETTMKELFDLMGKKKVHMAPANDARIQELESKIERLVGVIQDMQKIMYGQPKSKEKAQLKPSPTIEAETLEWRREYGIQALKP